MVPAERDVMNRATRTHARAKKARRVLLPTLVEESSIDVMDTHYSPIPVNRESLDDAFLNLLDEQRDLSDRFDKVEAEFRELKKWQPPCPMTS